MNRCILAILFTMALGGVACGSDLEITPFRTINQSPLVQIFGLPAETAATVVPQSRLMVSLTQDVASNYTQHSNTREQLLLDGESYRWVLSARYGLGPRWEAGVEVPYVVLGGGFLDGFIMDWHRTFGLPQGGRDEAPRNRLDYSYVKDGVQRLGVNRSGSGIGDISLTSGLNIYSQQDAESRDELTLRAALKLPSGDSSALRGSGSVDLSLLLCGSMENRTEWGTLGLYGSLGGLVMSEGRVLREQQNRLAGLGTLGLGWGPTEWLAIKFQLNGHTALYRDSALPEIGANALMLVAGGTVKLPGAYLLDIGVSEDVAVATAPDVSFHLGLSKQF